VKLTRGLRGGLLGLVLIGGLALAGCSSSPTTPKAAPATSTSTTSASSTSTSTSTTAPSGTPLPPAPGAKNLTATAAVKNGLLAAYLAHSGLAADQVGGTAPGSVYYAYLPSSQTYWAAAGFVPSSTATMQTQVSMQDDGCCGIFTQASGAASWTFAGSYLGAPCPGTVPLQVLTVWNLPPGADCPSN
jgi:hypothetical protein